MSKQIFRPKRLYKMEGFRTLGDVQKDMNKQFYEACKQCLTLLCSTDYALDCETNRRTVRKDFLPQAMDIVAKLKDIITAYEGKMEV